MYLTSIVIPTANLFYPVGVDLYSTQSLPWQLLTWLHPINSSILDGCLGATWTTQYVPYNGFLVMPAFLPSFASAWLLHYIFFFLLVIIGGLVTLTLL